MIFYNKIKWIVGILLVFVIIVTTNLIDRNNFIRVKDSVETMYKDRVVADGLLFSLLGNLHEKEIAFISNEKGFYTKRNVQLNEEIELMISNYELTRLTEKEQVLFDKLKENLRLLSQSETNFANSDFVDISNLSGIFQEVKKNLRGLSNIQLNEGGRQMSISKRAIDTMELFTKIEIYLLIFLAIFIQIIVIYNPKKK